MLISHVVLHSSICCTHRHRASFRPGAVRPSWLLHISRYGPRGRGGEGEMGWLRKRGTEEEMRAKRIMFRNVDRGAHFLSRKTFLLLHSAVRMKRVEREVQAPPPRWPRKWMRDCRFWKVAEMVGQGQPSVQHRKGVGRGFRGLLDQQTSTCDGV